MSFETDLALLAANCKNEHLVERIRRKHDTALLNYQLKKRHLQQTEQSPSIVPSPPPSLTASNAEHFLRKQEPPEPSAHPQPKTAKTAVSYATLEHYQHTRYEDMPTPQTQELWLKNRDEYKTAQNLHLKLKNATTNEDRAEIRANMLQLLHQVKGRWALIDSEILRLSQEKKEEADETLKIATIRTYITKSLKRENLTDKQRLELQRRVDALIAANETIKPETIARLQEKGITI